MKKDIKQIIERLIDLQEKYSFEKRHLVTGDRYEEIMRAGMVADGDYSHTAVREPLLEHVGHLPVLAAFLHPYIDHTNEVDLGRVLIMLAIHDIGETEVGDVFTYDKTEAEETKEYQAAMNLLEPSQQVYYEEFEARETLDAKYTKAIDVLAPIVHSMNRPFIKIENFKQKGKVVQDVVIKKQHYFEWDLFLLELFDVSITHYQHIEKGESGLFTILDR